MNLADEIRQQIEKCKDLKLDIGEINNHLSTLEGLVRNDIEALKNEAYRKGYDKGYADKTNNDEVCKQIAKDIQDEAYQRGLDEAWKAARKISVIELNGGLTGKELMKIYGTMDIHKIYDDNTASEAIEKLKAYEEKQKTDNCIEIGDEVEWNGDKYIVTYRNIDINMGVIQDYDLLGDDGSVVDHVKKCSFTKTGRHFDIQSILEEMRHD